jgi:NAD(P)-dependent dehydrogenase (short-subunit alcohol dehydrogenase family)
VAEARVALVTGGSRGIGRAISLGLAEDGLDVAVNFRKDKEAADDTVGSIEALGRRAAAFPASIDSYEDTAALIDGVVQWAGRLDVLVNNAGVSNRGRLVADTEVDDLERVMRTNALGVHQLCRAALPALRASGSGAIVMISSLSAVSNDPYGAPYNMAKAAAESLAYTLAKEEAAHGVRVNVVAPALTNTEMGRRLVKSMGLSDIHALDANFGLGRVCEPEDIAGAVRYLVSDRSTIVTGQRIAVDSGGFTPSRA